MLDKNVLSQLQSLKQEIRESVPHFTGRVRASRGRYGFVNTDDGASYFLTPDEMDKVLPEDTIEFRVEPTPDGKEQAIVEKLIETEISEFYGTYIVRGKGHFIDPDHPTLKRWVFVPPKLRQGAKDGDLVKGHISLHPLEKGAKGKLQASVDTIIGNLSDPGIEQNFTLSKWNLPVCFGLNIQDEIKRLQKQSLTDLLETRTDLSHLPFVTIDSASTRDLDDALFAEAHSEGWTLWIAIADPSAWIQEGSLLDAEAYKRATSVYLPDFVIPMLPAEVSEQLCSLQANELRPAMVVELRINEDGTIRQMHLHQAAIKSQAKLTYNQVSQLVKGESSDISADLQGPLLHLNDCANALSQWRKTHALVMDERPDYKLILDECGKVQDIITLERTVAHRIVEECMLACNRSVAIWLAEQNTGFFIEHGGLRFERLPEVSELLKEQLGLEETPDLSNLSDYIHWNQQADKAESDIPLRLIISRQQERSNLSLEAKPHYGLGFSQYTTFTSPLRKYYDLLLHRVIKQLLNNETPTLPSAEKLLSIQTAQTNARLASMQVENWLKLQWLDNQEKEQLYDASIVYVGPFSISVRLDNTGIEGNVELRKKGEEWTFDSKTMSQTNGEVHLQLGQSVRVAVTEVQAQACIARFKLVQV